MANTTAGPDKKIAQSREMSRFYRALAVLSSNAVNRVMKQSGADKKIGRANVETKRLVAAANLGGNHKCPPGQIWDEFA